VRLQLFSDSASKAERKERDAAFKHASPATTLSSIIIIIIIIIIIAN